MIIAENLRKFREQKGLSMGQLGRSSGISNSLISRIEKGDHTSWETINKLAKSLEIEPSELCNEPYEHEEPMLIIDEKYCQLRQWTDFYEFTLEVDSTRVLLSKKCTIIKVEDFVEYLILTCERPSGKILKLAIKETMDELFEILEGK